MRKDQKTATLLPELLGGKRGALPWSIEESGGGGRTNISAATIAAPLDPEPCLFCGANHARTIRQHELLHARFSPKQRSKKGSKQETVPDWALEVAEEGRVNVIGREIGLLRESGLCHQRGELTGSVRGLSFSMPFPRWVIAGTAATKGSADERAYIEGIRSRLRSMEESGELSRAERELASICIESAREITSLLDRKRKNSPAYSVAVTVAERLAELDAVAGALAQAEGKEGESAREMLRGAGSIPTEGNPGSLKWGEMEIISPPLDSIASTPYGRTIAAPSGVMLAHPERAWQGGTARPYRRKRRAPRGGTWLVDVSGSMDFEREHLQELLSLAPAAMVATYNAPRSRRRGELVIVGRDQRLMSSLDSVAMRGANLIDLPALEWLSKQPGPRVWVSDGGVWPIEGEPYDARAACAVEMARGGIRRIGTIHSAIDELRGGKRESAPLL